MSLPFPDHPLRHAVTQELHVRTFEAVRAPAAVAHLAYVCGERGSGVNVAHLLRLLSHFGVATPDAAEVGQYYSRVAGGAGLAWSDLRIHADGFGRILLRDCGLTDTQAGRLVKRVLDVNTYRATALLGLPAARSAAGILSDPAD